MKVFGESSTKNLVQWFYRDWFRNYLAHYGETEFVREAINVLKKGNKESRDFLNELVASVSDQDNAAVSIKEILTNKNVNFDEAIGAWLKKENVSIQRKKPFLMRHYGQSPERFEEALENLPEIQAGEFWQILSKESNIGLYEKLARTPKKR